MKSAPTFKRIVHLNLQIVSSLDLLTHQLYQWNADGIRLKFTELRDRLINSDINVLAAEDSKPRKTDKTPFIEGYATIRKDRNNILGGGLLIFIQTDIVFEKLHSFEKVGTHSSQGY